MREPVGLKPLDPSWHGRHFVPIMCAIFCSGIVLLVSSAFTGAGGDLIVGDGILHFEYARSLMIDGHLPRRHINYPFGVSLIGLVGYAPSICLARAMGWLASGRAAEGWSLFNQFAFCLPLIALAAVGAWSNLRMLERLGIDRDLARFALVVWFVGTNIPWYVFKDPAMSESATYSTLSLYYFFLVKALYPQGKAIAGGSPGVAAQERASTEIIDWMRIGFFLGLASIVRQQNALHGVALVALAVIQEWSVWRARPALAIGRMLRAVIPATALALAIFSLPYFVWSVAAGPTRVYAYGAQGFNFLQPHLLDVLFRPRANGLFIWTPLFALAAVGWWPLFRTHPKLAAPLLLAAFIQYYLIASWWAYSFGTSVGHRGFFTVLPILLPGLAALLQASRRRGLVRPLSVLMLGLCAINLIYLLAISVGYIRPRG